MTSSDVVKRDRAYFIDKARGALFGLAIGDALGDIARKPEVQRDYGFITDFITQDAGSTDDTEFALLVARTIIQCGGDFSDDDVESMWLMHVATQDKLPRGGSSEMDAANNLRKGLHAPQTGMYGTYCVSDGAAMRAGPIGIYCAGNPRKARELCRIDSQISHSGDGIWGAQMVAVAVSLAMVDAPFREIFDEALACAPEGSWLHAKMLTAYDVTNNETTIPDAWMKLHGDLFTSYRAATPEAIPAVFGCLRLSHDTFRDGLILAANYGRDADTIGAVVGCILGARYGLGAIPKDWVQKTRYPSGTCLQFAKGMDLMETADELAGLIKV